MHRSILNSKAIDILKQEGFSLSYMEDDNMLIVSDSEKDRELFVRAAQPLVDHIREREKQHPHQDLVVIVDKNAAKLYRCSCGTGRLP